MRTQQTKSSGGSVLAKSTAHVPVLLQEVIHWLDIQPADVVFDGTLGGAGHSRAIAESLDKGGALIATDVDSKAIETGRVILANAKPKVILAHTNFKDIKQICADEGLAGIDKVLLDLGWSSDQIEGGTLGLSFMRDEPLSMRLADAEQDDALTAQIIVNEWSEESIADILYGWGGERYSRRIAKAIVEARQKADVSTTFALVDIIKGAVPGVYRHGRIHPATRTFQALRIAVNDEIGALRSALTALKDVLLPNGRAVVITFHSIEDRVVKHTFRGWKEEGLGEILTKKPITASEAELQSNPRARSAKLRVFHKYESR